MRISGDSAPTLPRIILFPMLPMFLSDVATTLPLSSHSVNHWMETRRYAEKILDSKHFHWIGTQEEKEFPRMRMLAAAGEHARNRPIRLRLVASYCRTHCTSRSTMILVQ